VGVCVDFPYESTSCQPSIDRPVPPGAQAALTAAAADARVACALAGDAVRGRFGPTMKPILGSVATESPDCYFAEPDHTTFVEVFVYLNDDLTTFKSSYNGQDRFVAGRSAILGSKGDDLRLCVLAVPGAKTGVLCVVVHFFPGHGKELSAEPETRIGDQLEPAMTDILSQHFS